jgi:hypothetical protein
MIIQSVLCPLKSSWWAKVAVTPLIKRIKVLRRGTWNGGIISNPIKGQDHLLLVKGEILMWKNLQNTLKKNQTSLKRNQIRPHFNPLWTKVVCWPWKALSRVISRNQKKNNLKVNVNNIRVNLSENPNLNQNRTLTIKRKLPILILKGSHLLSTTCESCHAFYFFFEKEMCYIHY